MTTNTGYCAGCDAEDSGGEPGECSRCGASLYDSYDAYVDEMVAWLGDSEDMSEEAVVDLLNGHGNPTKGQARAILAERENEAEANDDYLRDGESGVRYGYSHLTDTWYRVTEWKDLGDGKIQAHSKEQVPREEVPEIWREGVNERGGDGILPDGGTVHGIITPVDGHPIPADPDELAEKWGRLTDSDYGSHLDDEPPHPDEAREEFVQTIARWSDWHVFRAKFPFAPGDTVYLWNGLDGQCLAIDGAEGRWHELVNLFAEIVDEEGDCRDAEYSGSLMPSGAYDQRCKSCGSRWSI